MKNLKFDLTQVADLDPLTVGTRMKIPAKRASLPGEETLLTTALNAYCALGGGKAPIIRSALDFRATSSVPVSVKGAIKAAPTRSATDWTACLGPNASGGAVVAFGAGGGVYFWNKPKGGEIGLYGGYSVGMVTNIGVSLVGQFTYLWGPAPTMLAGTSIVVGVDVSVPTGILTGGGALIFSESPVQWIGFSFSLGVGASAVPYDFTIQASKTWIKPKVTVP